VKFPTLQKNKTVNVTLSDPSPGTDLGTQDTAVVTIVNDKKQTITFTNGAGDAVTLTLQHAGTMEATSQEPLTSRYRHRCYQSPYDQGQKGQRQQRKYAAD